ncbi:DUF2202 domain-containing protein [Nitratifractor sp.]
MKKSLITMGIIGGLAFSGISVSAADLTEDPSVSATSEQSQLQLTKARIKRLFAGKTLYYIDWHLKDHPIIGVADFDDAMESMDYRQIIGGTRRGSVDLILRQRGFTVLWPKKRFVKITKIRKSFIETGTKKLFRFYPNKKTAQAYLTRQGYDVVPPKIEILGDNPMRVEQYQRFVDPGATAVDAVDGSVEVTSRGRVNTAKIGTYFIRYLAQDSAGNRAVKRRTVNVVTEEGLSDEQKYALAYMWNEEKLAKDIYLALNELTPHQTLENIATRSEVRHEAAVEDLVQKYDINITNLENYEIRYSEEELRALEPGQYAVPEIQELYDALYAKGSQSLQDALEVGCMVEVTDVDDLDKYIEIAAGREDLIETFDFLRSGSYNHYWAFDRALKNMGISDGCCSLGDEYCKTEDEYPKSGGGGKGGGGKKR